MMYFLLLVNYNHHHRRGRHYPKGKLVQTKEHRIDRSKLDSQCIDLPVRLVDFRTRKNLALITGKHYLFNKDMLLLFAGLSLSVFFFNMQIDCH